MNLNTEFNIILSVQSGGLIMRKVYLVTGANGHLGSTVLRVLRSRGAELRGLILEGETYDPLPGVTYFEGDVRNPNTLRPMFEGLRGRPCYVVHTAGIIDISDQVSPLAYQVNVGGTKNILALCREYKVKRLLYVSSVHAIPEGDKACVLHEVNHFSADEVVGGYAKTKAEATQAVLDAARNGLDAVVVHPSGILGPYDRSGNHLVQMVNDYLHGKLPACVRGGYDLVDVRDVAAGCLLALEKGRKGECYILSNRHYEIKDVLAMIRHMAGGRRLATLPHWLARAALPAIRLHARRTKRRPLFTRYSLYTLLSNDKFSHDKATAELGYRPRDLMQTLRDTISWEKGELTSAIQA